jgi:taurine ABC transporter substrate-binding protein
MKLKSVIATLAVATLALAGCSVDRSGDQADKPTIRIGYQSFPSGDLIVKNSRWLEEKLPNYNIKWTKFDSGADVNTAFIAKELDFGALGSSPVARGLSAPLNIPYKVAFVLDVAGDNEALVARNGSGINTIAELKGKRIGTPFASTAHYSLLAALSQNGLSANDVQLVDLQPQAILAAFDRGDIDAAYSWLPTLDQLRKNGKDLITSRQLAKDGKPTLDLGAVSDEFASATSRRRRHLAAAGSARAQAHPRRSRCCGQGHRCRDWAEPRRGGRPAQAGRLPDAGAGRVAGMAWVRRQAGQHCGQPAERVAVPRRPEADSVGSAATDLPGRDLHQGPARCHHPVMARSGQRRTSAVCASAGCRTATAAGGTRSPRWDPST